MLHHKDIKNLSELKSTFVATHKKEEFFTKFIDILQLGKVHAVFSSIKKKGVPVLLLIRLLISFPFIEQHTVHSYTKSFWHQYEKIAKDSFYRLKNNPFAHWRNILFSIVRQVLKTIAKREGSKNDNPKALIFDDSTIAKRGKKIEGVSKVWDHVIHRSILGFQLLVMGYYDGTMFIPIDFSFHRSKGKNKKYLFGLRPKDYKKQFKKKRDKSSYGYTRKKELDKSKIEMAITMIKRALKNKIEVQYVLTDSWFTSWEIVKTAIINNLTYIGMFSKSTTKFGYMCKSLTYKQIRKMSRKKIKRNRRFKLYYIRTVVDWQGQKVVLYFTRKGKNGNWKVLLSTDLSSKFQDTVEVYQIRWSIEVFFKESKQLLGLGQSQSNDFDAQIADTTITMIQYILLALRKRVESYESIGAMFEKTKEFTLEQRLHERLIALLIVVFEVLENLFDEIEIERIMLKAIHEDQAWSKLLRLLEPVEKECTVAA